MRYIFLVFGFVFFTMIFTAGLWADRTFALVVRDACIAAVVGGLAGQWFWNHVLDAMRITVAVKRATAEAAAKANRLKRGETAVAKAKK
jgi:ABC-type proline/glycine betaine transport system permease subunit